MIFNSDKLKQRRAGNQRGINEAELAEAVAGSNNSPKAMLHWLLTKGFLPTQIADSFAIASGGATYYRNKIIAYKKQGFTTFTIHPELLRKMVYDISMLDLEDPPKNKLRKVIFKPYNRLCIEEKLRIVGTLIGRSKKAHPDDIYDAMLGIHDNDIIITIARLAEVLFVSTRTIHRNMCQELKKEKELLNREL